MGNFFSVKICILFCSVFYCFSCATTQKKVCNTRWTHVENSIHQAKNDLQERRKLAEVSFQKTDSAEIIALPAEERLRWVDWASDLISEMHRFMAVIKSDDHYSDALSSLNLSANAVVLFSGFAEHGDFYGMDESLTRALLQLDLAKPRYCEVKDPTP